VVARTSWGDLIERLTNPESEVFALINYRPGTSTVKSLNFLGTKYRGLTVSRHWECSWTLEFVDFKLYAILLK